MYSEKEKLKIARERIEDGATIQSLSKKYHVSAGSISRWTTAYRNSDEFTKHPDTIENLQKRIAELELGLIKKEGAIEQMESLLVKAGLLPDKN